MEDIVGALWSARNGSEALGRVIMGMTTLAARYDELWLIVEGQSANRIRSADIGVSLGGITVGGRLLVPFCDVKAWERDCGEPCVAFEMSGKEAIIAPASAPEDDSFIKEALGFITNDVYDSDILYLSSLDGPVGTRPTGQDTIEIVPDREGTHAEGQETRSHSLGLHGEEMRLGDITWAERDSDGDGNRFLHIVMDDGRYRRIASGDLGR